MPTASSKNPNGIPAELLSASAAQLTADRPGWFRAGTAAYFGEPDTTPLSPQMQAGLNMCLQTSLLVLQACMHTMVSADLRDDLRTIGVPALVVHGDADASAPLTVTGQPTAELLSHGRLLVYPGAARPLRHRAEPAQRRSARVRRDQFTVDRAYTCPRPGGGEGPRPDADPPVKHE
jgi:non-heme chloroperoxidase